jgi:hypothetical protein
MPATPKPPPPGWRLFGRQLVPDPTVGGYLARRQEFRGSCHRRDCRRRYDIDFDGLIRHGYAGFPVRELQALLACRMPGGCSLQFHEKPVGLPLRAFYVHDGVTVLLRCEACRWEKEVAPARLAAQLKAQGLGDDGTPHTDIAAKLTKPCKCGKTQWACEVLWPPEVLRWQSAAISAELKLRRALR